MRSSESCEPPEFREMRGISSLAGRLLASQEYLKSMELVN
jgi:hypothetical protein